MSEIFKWLKKTEQNTRSSSELGNKSADLGVIDPPAEAEEPDRLVVFPTPIPARHELHGAGRFDFSAADPLITIVLDPCAPEGEQYRLLRAKLSSIQKERTLKKILITSAAPNEGKTFTSCCLAGILAQETGKRVLLVDADLRRPSAAQMLGCPEPGNTVGLCQILRGEIAPEEAMLKSVNMEMFLLPSGGVPPNPSELLSSPNLDRAMNVFAELFDWVLVDSPPILALADATLLAPVCDAVLVVVRSEHAPAKLIQEGVQRIGREKVCGVAVNRIKRRLYSNYYHRYYADTKR
jgi:capsular exopolysaccharide synthesis family protein